METGKYQIQLDAQFQGVPDNRVSFYKTGKKYTLTLEFVYNPNDLLPAKLLILSPKRCPYSSLNSFYKNWKIVGVGTSFDVDEDFINYVHRWFSGNAA